MWQVEDPQYLVLPARKYQPGPPLPYDIPVLAFDQFDFAMGWEFMVADHDCLCVPSWKNQVVRTESRTWSGIKDLYRD